MQRSAKSFFLKTQTFISLPPPPTPEPPGYLLLDTPARSGGICAHIVAPSRTHELAALCGLKGADLRR